MDEAPKVGDVVATKVVWWRFLRG